MAEEPGRELAPDLRYWSTLEGNRPPPNATYNDQYEKTDRGKRKALSPTWYRRTNEVGRYVVVSTLLVGAGVALWYNTKDKLIDVELDPQVKRLEQQRRLLQQQQQQSTQPQSQPQPKAKA